MGIGLRAAGSCKRIRGTAASGIIYISPPGQYSPNHGAAGPSGHRYPNQSGSTGSSNESSHLAQSLRAEKRSGMRAAADITKGMSRKIARKFLLLNYRHVSSSGGVKFYERKYLPPSMAASFPSLRSRFGPTTHQPFYADGFCSDGDPDPNVSTAASTPAVTKPKNQSTQIAHTEHWHKRKAFAQHWNALLPSLVHIFLEVKAATDRGRLPCLAPSRSLCVCRRSRLRVTCVHYNHLSYVTLSVCTCASAAAQLLKRGFFPASPTRPQLAVSINHLDFVSIASTKLTPNVRAWAVIMGEFLACRGYQFDTESSLRKRLGQTLEYYQILVQMADNRVTHAIEESRSHIEECSGPTSYPPPLPVYPSSSSPASSTPNPGTCANNRSPRANAAVLDNFASTSNTSTQHSLAPLADPPALELPIHVDHDGDITRQANVPSRPSAYLRSRCPICFGGPNVFSLNNLLDILVCLDGNFTQKRTVRGGVDPHLPYPSSIFIDPNKLERMRAAVEQTRKKKTAGSATTHKVTSMSTEEDEDVIEPGMRVPKSALDSCLDSFTAADEDRQKASTQFFADTGLMALLCRHDCVIHLANMQTPGEGQFYALALLDELFEGLPETSTVGVLYDIGCQLHRSVVKWDFLPRWSGRMTFAISVFHAYGHQWACQITYHPRKRAGFGLTNGEGSERFWSSICRLIPGLRNAGFHHRLFTLDSHVAAQDRASLPGLASWIANKWKIASARLREAMSILSVCTVSEASLQAAWKNQLMSQRKPLPRQSKNRGLKQVETVIALQELRASLLTRQGQLNKQLLEELKVPSSTSTSRAVELRDEIELSAETINDTQATLARQEEALGRVGGIGYKMLNAVRANEFFEILMNMRALKHRIRSQLQQCKFELSILTDLHRGVAADHSTRKHVSDASKRRQPAIMESGRKFNKLCERATIIKAAGRSVGVARIPDAIDLKGIWDLGVDSPLWEDVSLEEEQGAVPTWLGDEETRRGIVQLLESQRCKEELHQLKWERTTLQNWFVEHDEAIRVALHRSTDNALSYHLACELERIRAIGAGWQSALQKIPMSPLESPPSSWPSNLNSAPGYFTHKYMVALRVASGEVSLPVTVLDENNWFDDDTDDCEDEGASEDEPFLALDPDEDPLSERRAEEDFLRAELALLADLTLV